MQNGSVEKFCRVMPSLSLLSSVKNNLATDSSMCHSLAAADSKKGNLNTKKLTAAGMLAAP